MKNFKQLVLVFLVATVTLTSCNNDDDSSSASLIGAWEFSQESNQSGVLEDYEHTPDCTKDYIEFLSDGALKSYFYGSFGPVVCQEFIDEATWVRVGNTITITEDTETYEAEILELTDSTLKLKSLDDDITVYTRK